jgi:hypothetical protein
LRIRVGGLLEDQPAAANKNASECQDCWREPQNTPNNLGKPPEPAKMQFGKPIQALVGEMVRRIEEEEGIKRLWERKIDS